jgi:AraC-like DNA-binding protein
LDNYSPTIATLANLLAFPSPSAFARQFKQQYGLTPTEYQRRKE